LKIFQILKNKKKGFTLLEVMFAVIIVTVAFSGIFLFIANMVQFLEKTRKYGQSVSVTPIIYDSNSPLLFEKWSDDDSGEKELYSRTNKIDPQYILNFNCFYIAQKEMHSSEKIINTSNFFYKNMSEKKRNKNNE
jgi:prepilin-type N-terminal cleavage/methylation domain-containing protein